MRRWAHHPSKAIFWVYGFYLILMLGQVSAANAVVIKKGSSDTPSVPIAETSIAIPGLSADAKPTAGDVVELSIIPPSLDLRDATLQNADALSKGFLTLGQGKILWWTPAGPENKIVIGVTAYSPGKFDIPEIHFEKAGRIVFSSQSQQIEFSFIGGDKSMDALYPPIAVAFPTWVWGVFGLLGAAILFGVGWIFIRWRRRVLERRRREEEIRNRPRPLTPLEEFEALCKTTLERGFLDQGRFKPHYFALSDGLKRFLSKTYRIDAEEMTTRELVQALESAAATNEANRTSLQALLHEMDLVKFTDTVPELGMARSLSSRLNLLARNLV